MPESTADMIETPEKVFSEKDLLLGILWEGDSQLHTNAPGMAKTAFGSTIVHGNSVTSMVIGDLFKVHFANRGKVTLKRLDVSYLDAVHVGERIRGVFGVRGRRQAEKEEILEMNFEVFKNGESRVSRGTLIIEVQ